MPEPLQKRIQYFHDEVILEGYLSRQAFATQRSPGIIIAHEWMGIEPHIIEYADALALRGYTAFVVDLYGKSNVPENYEEAKTLSDELRNNRHLLRERMLAGLDVLRQQDNVDASRIAAIGFSLGGCAVMELGRTGENIKGLVSFYGDVGSPHKENAKLIKGKVLVLHGGSDPYVNMEHVTDFNDEMKSGNIACEIVIYSQALHGFSNPKESKSANAGSSFDEHVHCMAWERMLLFLEEVFS
ncbi:dienelactone hydrolase family protein [Fulvivirgaceae bacterium BMA10]|uniref:Dienelactone hydrolase family protein n=1 Tax=Splendidivirga corallicola TaxID=3051826 RepID=A0ABT8KUM2_9BACT|nr:dienelactone hydrolase family protein [Fulvivirgaceae bacterium BMA10]